MAFKASDDFQFKKEWWSKGKPLTLASTGLGEVLGQYEILVKEVRDRADAGTYKNFNGSLPFARANDFLNQKVTPAVKKSKDACSKTLHKECIAVLGKYTAALQKEITAITNAESKFDTAYAKNLKKLRDPATALHHEIDDDYAEAARLTSEAHKEATAIETLGAAVAKAPQSPAAQKAYVDALRRLGLLEEYTKKVAKISDDLVKKLNELKGMDGMHVLSDDDRNVQIAMLDDGQDNRNKIARCLNDIHLLHTNAEGDVEDMAGQFDGKGPSIESLVASLKKVNTSLEGYSTDSRRLDNYITGWIGNTRAMVKAKIEERKGTPLEEAAKAQMLTFPPVEWPQRCNGWKNQAKILAQKNTQLLTTAKGLRDKALSRLTDQQRLDPAIAKLITKSGEHINGITAYETTIDNHRKDLDVDIQKLGF